MSKLTHGPYPLLGILLLALLLRVWGLTWGLPSATHYFSYHPDESVVLGVASSMNLFKGQMLPHWYHYGSLQIYLVNITNSAAFLFGAVDIVPKDFAVWYPQWARMYLIGRCLTVGMGVGTVWATYALGTRLWGRRAGILAAGILAIMPLHAQHSHWLTVDVPATFWGVLSLVWTARLAQSDPKPLRAALWTGFFAGLAAATKYSMALVLLPLAALCFIPFLTGRRVKLLFVGLLAAALAFLVACPGAVLEPHQFFADLRFEGVHVNNPNDPTFKDTGNGFVYHVTHTLDAGLGLPLLLFALISISYALYRRERGDGLLAAFALPYYVLIGLAAVRYARYVIPLLPVLALWSGRLLADLSRLPQTVWRRSATAVGAVVLIGTLGDCVLLIHPMTVMDNRDLALRRIDSLAPATVGFPVQPWFGTVPVNPYFAASKMGAWASQTAPAAAAHVVYTGKDWDTALLETAKPTIIVLSEYDYRDALRMKQPAALAFLTALRQEYVCGDIFPAPGKELPGYSLEDGLPVHVLPHDMLYTNPAIVIFQRK